MESLYSLLHQGFLNIAPFIILLGFLVFVHESGHFLVAKWCGVRVQTFSLGFGKKIFQYKKGDTTYCISLIPLGGYVKMFGDEVGADIAPQEQRYSFTHKKLWQRIAVVVAGPLMNFFFAILIFTVVAFTGEEVRKPVVGDISTDTAAFKDGLRSGDEVTQVNGTPVQTWEEFQEDLNHFANTKVVLAVKRAGSEQPLRVEATPTLKPNDNILSLTDYVADVEGLNTQSRAPVLGVVAKSKAESLGLQTGDRVISVNGKPVTYFRELENLLVTNQGNHIEFEVMRGLDKEEKKKIEGNILPVSSLQAFGLEEPDLYLAKIVDGSPAASAGLLPGDKIITIESKSNKVTPTKWEDVLNVVKNFSGEGALHITVLRGEEKKGFDIAPKVTAQMTHQGAEEKRYTIGIMPWVQSAPPMTTTLLTRNPAAALARGYKKTMEVTTMTIVSFLRLIQNKISPKNIGGVISIGKAASETFKTGMSYFLQLMGIISINLFILNLLPIPVLDGGHLLFYVIEGLRGAPVSMRKMEIAQQVGLVVLMSLMALSLFNDFSRVFGLW
jgi:regulator of sigma E protease